MEIEKSDIDSIRPILYSETVVLAFSQFPGVLISHAKYIIRESMKMLLTLEFKQKAASAVTPDIT